MRGSLSRRWLMQKRANTDAKARTSARVKAVARPATMVAKARTPAKAKGAAAPREAHRPALQGQALPHQALQLQAEISASVHDSLQILICARNRFTGSWRGVLQGSLYHNSKVASGIRILKEQREGSPFRELLSSPCLPISRTPPPSRCQFAVQERPAGEVGHPAAKKEQLTYAVLNCARS